VEPFCRKLVVMAMFISQKIVGLTFVADVILHNLCKSEALCNIL